MRNLSHKPGKKKTGGILIKFPLSFDIKFSSFAMISYYSFGIRWELSQKLP